MLDIVFVEVKDFLLELQKNYLGSLEEKGRDVSVGLSGPKVLEDIWHFLVTQEIVLLVFFFCFFVFFSVHKHTVNSSRCFSFWYFTSTVSTPLYLVVEISVSAPLYL